MWEHFKREKHGQTAQFKMCRSVLKTTGGSTKGLHEQLLVGDNSTMVMVTLLQSGN